MKTNRRKVTPVETKLDDIYHVSNVTNQTFPDENKTEAN